MDGDEGSSSNTGLIVGIIAGIAVFAALGIGLYVHKTRKLRR